ncbi:hypothetical protein [Cupriavidus taiwanensis]|uniref:hypothetical protein n=1 Tax=Cupriavidus taiwanensis TaxID=164546 RepID=UPI000E2FBC36|nr:hypothetical protein [Cupriavidus taiwanensis]
MAWKTEIQEPELKRFLLKSATYLFHPRRIAAIAHRELRRAARPPATVDILAQRGPFRRQPTAT